MRTILDNKSALKSLKDAIKVCEDRLTYENPDRVLYTLRDAIKSAITTAEFMPVSQDTSRDISEIETVLKISEGLYS